MTTYVRIYKTEDGANAAIRRLARAGFRDNKVYLPSAAAGKEEETVQAAVEAGVLPASQSRICVQSLKEGESVVTTYAPFGRGKAALGVMKGAGAVKSDVLERYSSDDPAPFSELLGIPTLTNVKPSAELLSSNWSFSSKLGLGLLSKNPTPLSSMLGLPVVSKAKKNWKLSFGLPLLSSSAAPLSSMFGLPTLSKTQKDWRTSFGVPLLVNDPAPLSNLFGLKTIIRD